MATFQAGVEGVSPLLVQLTATSAAVEVVGLDLCGDNALGSTSRPTLYRPAIPGTFTGFIPPLNPGFGGLLSPTADFLTTFSTPPSIPVSPTSSVKVPFQILWRAAPGNGYVVLPGESVVLYANTAGGHAWTATMLWEEA